MILYRLKQFKMQITAKITLEDKAFINKYLTPEEVCLFDLLKVYDQKHSLLVAETLQTLYRRNTNQYKKRFGDNVNEKYLVKLGLLHDIGKSVRPLNPVEKGLVMVLDLIPFGIIQNSKIMKAYHYHGQYGYKILTDNNIMDENFRGLVCNHHVKDITNIDMRSLNIKNPNWLQILKLLQTADDMC